MKPMIYDPIPHVHDWLSYKFFHSLSRDIPFTNTLDVKNSTILTHAFYLKPDVIRKLKENNNKIISFDINDTTWLSTSYSTSDAAKEIDIIFKFAGIQQTDTSLDISINSKLEFGLNEREFIKDPKQLEIYRFLADAGRLIPMPHMGFYSFDLPAMPSFTQRQKKVLVRGLPRYTRYLLFLSLVKQNLADGNSAFLFSPTGHYGFDHCAKCKKAFATYGNIPYSFYKSETWENCTARKKVDFLDAHLADEKFDSKSNGLWNGNCIPMHYWLADKFQETHGGLSFGVIENAMKTRWGTEKALLHSIGEYAFYGDSKWIFSIDIPPRFWQAANARAINICPEWTKNQKHFPELLPNVHYLPYAADFSDLEKLNDVTETEYNTITENAYSQYRTWIHTEKRDRLSSNLRDRVLERV